MILLDRIETWALEQPEKVALSFLNEQGDVEDSVTYKELSIITSTIAIDLLSRLELHRGDRVLLVYPPSLDFILSFIACLKAGLIAVPLFPPDPRRMDKGFAMFNTVALACGANFALTSETYNYASKVAALQRFITFHPTLQWPTLTWIVTDSLIKSGKQEQASNSSWKTPEIFSKPSVNPAFLQYTSGSSSEPKGVIITEENLDHNLSLIARSLQTTPSTVCVSWLPQYHDMGLIGSYLGLIWCGGTGRYFSPVTFIRNPVLWITVLSRYRATHTQAPDFAFALTARKFLSLSQSQRKLVEATLDLSSLQHMINAAEPVRYSSIEMFRAVFEKYGLNPEVIYPTYGLAEHTVLVSSNGRTHLRLDQKELQINKVTLATLKVGVEPVILMSCGNPNEFGSCVDVKIVSYHEEDPTRGGIILPDNEVGEIWINSASKAYGYWNGDSILTAKREEFTMSLESSNDEKVTYLRTGDLGFLREGELYICGRVKDVIIIRGKNIYPQDIEIACEGAFPELRSGCSAAFSITKPRTNQEVLIYVAEMREEESSLDQTTFFNLSEKIVATVLQQQGVLLETILLIPTRTIPKTTSGKIARQWVKKAFLEESLSILFHFDTSCSSQKSRSMADDLTPTTTTETPSLLLASERNKYSDAIDPQGMTEDSLLQLVMSAVQETISDDGFRLDNISPDDKLISLGLDSSKLPFLQEMLCRKFTTQLSDDLLFDPEVTLRMIVRALSSDGNLAPRPFMVETWKLVEFLRGQQTKTGKVPVGIPTQWINKNKIQADPLTHTFPDNCALTEAPLSRSQDRIYILFALFSCGVFFWLPAIGLLLFWTLPLKQTLAIIVVFYTIMFTIPADRWPPSFRLTYLFQSAVDYFSVRVIVDAPHETSTPSIYAIEPHGWLPIPQSIHQLFNEWVTGENFHLLAANSVFWMPIFNIVVKLQGCLPVDKATFIKTLKSGHSVGVIPGGIAEMFEYLGPSSSTEVLKLTGRKGFVNIALKTGSQIIPCYTFGCWNIFETKSSKSLQHASRLTGIPFILFWGRYFLPIPLRTPILVVIGRPIQCPRVDNPTPELVTEFHEQYLRETKILFEKYKNTFDWKEKTLFFKK